MKYDVTIVRMGEDGFARYTSVLDLGLNQIQAFLAKLELDPSVSNVRLVGHRGEMRHR